MSEIVIKNYNREFFFFFKSGLQKMIVKRLFGKLIFLTRSQCFEKVQHPFTIMDNLWPDANMHSLI